MEKEKTNDSQSAFEYAIYVIIGSYFKKTSCISPQLEKTLKVKFLEQKQDKQTALEENCISYVEKKLLRSLPEQVWDGEAKVQLGIKNEERVPEVRFTTDKYMLRIFGRYKGKGTELQYKLLSKKTS
jgi:hypothetical protein